MANLYLLLVITFLSFVISNPIEYESLSADSYSNSKSDQIYEIDGETDAWSEDISQRLYKRQIDSDKPIQLSLSAIIENIENSLLDSALGASNVYEILTSKSDTDDNSNEKDIEHIVEKRQDDDDDKSKSKDDDEDDDTTKSKSSSDEKNSNSKTVLTHFKAREVPISDDHTAHVAVDRITVFVANKGFLPMIPSFDLHHSGLQHESIKEILEDAKNSSSNSSEENDNTEVNVESIVDVTTASTTGEIINKVTPKRTAEELKEAEEELKEKVAEVEAEPIILSARV